MDRSPRQAATVPSVDAVMPDLAGQQAQQSWPKPVECQVQIVVAKALALTWCGGGGVYKPGAEEETRTGTSTTCPAAATGEC